MRNVTLRPALVLGLTAGVGLLALISVYAITRSTNGTAPRLLGVPAVGGAVQQQAKHAALGVHRAAAPPPADVALPKAGALYAALSAAVGEVQQRYGRAQIAVMADSWRAPLIAGSGANAPMRLWSLSKPVTAATLLRIRAAQRIPIADQLPYMQRALERSDNCAQREMNLTLQDELGGVAQAAAAIRQTVALTGAHLNTTVDQTDNLGSACITTAYRGIPSADAARVALLPGTSTWTVTDALRFIHGLASGTLDRPGGSASVSGVLLPLLRAPKLPVESVVVV